MDAVHLIRPLRVIDGCGWPARKIVWAHYCCDKCQRVHGLPCLYIHACMHRIAVVWIHFDPAWAKCMTDRCCQVSLFANACQLRRGRAWVTGYNEFPFNSFSPNTVFTPCTSSRQNETLNLWRLLQLWELVERWGDCLWGIPVGGSAVSWAY